MLLLTLLPISWTVIADNQSYKWATDQRVFVVGDIHGDLEELVTLLRAAGIIDENNDWQAQQSHFVSVGDLLDRGPQSRDVMDFFMRLETQADLRGGAVHIVLGNHEQMNLIRDLRYVSDKDYLDYLSDESEALRMLYWQHFELTAHDKGESGEQRNLRDAFNERYPLGYFGHMQAFSSEGKYGAWLLSKPSVLQINDVLYVHGGISEEFPLTDLQTINQQSARVIRTYTELFNRLNWLNVFAEDDPYELRQKKLQEVIELGSIHPAWQDAQDFIAVDNAFDLSENSPFWYRGSALCHPLFEEPILQSALRHYNAERLVIGHTPTVSRTIESRLGGRVINVDTGLHRAYYGGQPMLLSLQKNQTQQFDGQRWSVLKPDQDTYRARYKAHTFEQWEEILRHAEVLSVEALEVNKTLTSRLFMKHDGQSFSAMFYTADDVPRGAKKTHYSDTLSFKYEVAAYRVAKALGIFMVPPTIIKTIDGQTGALQLLIDRSFDEEKRLATGEYPAASCQMSYQVNLMNVFDALIYNTGRNINSVSYNGDWDMWLDSHMSTFRSYSYAPSHLKTLSIAQSPSLKQSIQRLEMTFLTKMLGEFLDKRQIRALVKRRDWLLTRFP